MQRKKYKITAKLTYTITMNHAQTSMQKAREDVEMLIKNHMKNGLELKQIFDNKPPHIIYQVEKIDK